MRCCWRADLQTILRITRFLLPADRIAVSSAVASDVIMRRSKLSQIAGRSVTAIVASAMSRPTILPSTTETAAIGRKKKKR